MRMIIGTTLIKEIGHTAWPKSNSYTITIAICLVLIIILLAELTEAVRNGKQMLLMAVGQQVRFSCRTNHSTPVEWWYRESDNSPTKRLVFANGNFTSSYRDRVRPKNIPITTENYDFVLQHVQRSDEGNFICVEDLGFGAQHHFRLEVSDYVSAKVGSQIILPCYSTTNDVEWDFKSSSDADSLDVYSNGFIYDRFQDRFRVSKSSENEFNLEVKEVMERDSGFFSCFEDGDVFNDRHTVRVIVLRVASIGESVTLPCWTKYNVSVSWWFMRTTTGDRGIIYTHRVMNKAYMNRFTVDAASNGYYNMTIKNIQQSDYGFYVCLEKNGEKDQHFIELRKREPDVASERTTTITFDETTRTTDTVSSTSCTLEGVTLSLLVVMIELVRCFNRQRNRGYFSSAQQQRVEMESFTKAEANKP